MPPSKPPHPVPLGRQGTNPKIELAKIERAAREARRALDQEEVTPTGEPDEPPPLVPAEPRPKTDSARASGGWLKWLAIVPALVLAAGVVAQSAVTKADAAEAKAKTEKVADRVQALEVTVAKQSADLEYLKKASDEQNRKLDKLLEKKP